MGEQAVGVGQAACASAYLGVFDQRLFEEVERLAQAFLGALVQVIAALQIQVVRGEVLGRPPRAATPAAVAQLAARASWTIAAATRSCAANMSPSGASTDSDQR